MIRKLACLFVLAGVAASCSTEGPASSGTTPTDSTTNALEASGQLEFYVKVVGANGVPFRGESTSAAFMGFIPGIQYYSDVNKGSSGATHCTEFQLTKEAGPSSPQFAAAVASGETLQNVHFDFVHPNDNFIWQQVDLTGIRLSMVEQAVAPPDDISATVILEEETLVPAGTATVTLTSTPQNADGTAGANIVSTFTCKP
jgi:type VI protein secretion system component Hcp